MFECCHTYDELGLEHTAEMCALVLWYLAIYRHEDGHAIRTADGYYVHHLSRDAQIVCGGILLTRYK